MPDNHNDTMNQAGAADVRAPTTDHALVALYEQYRSALDADAAFERTAAATPGDKQLAERLYEGAVVHRDRADLLAQAICSIPADGMTGAFIQVRTLLEIEYDADAEVFHRVLAPTLVSIGNVLRGPTEAGDALRSPCADVSEIDPAIVVGRWHSDRRGRCS